MDIYTDEVRPVNVHVDPGEIELPAFLLPRRKQAAAAKPRRRIRPETWSSINAAIVRQHQTLAAVQPNSPRIRPSLPRLRWLEPAVGGA
jgi:hypothetical protein